MNRYQKHLIVIFVLVFSLIRSEHSLADIWEITYATAVNSNGTVAGSTSEFVFVWTLAEGIQELPSLDHDCSVFAAGGASGISADDSTVVGTFVCEAFRWTDVDGMQGIGFLPNGIFSSARGVSANGEMIVGWGREGIYEDGRLVGSGDPEAFHWTSSDGMQSLGFLPGGSSSRAFDISSDGSTIVGTAEDASGRVMPVRWTANGEVEQLEIPETSLSGFASAVSDDGAVVVGGDIRNDDATEGIAGRWTADGTFQSLGVLPGEVNSGVSGVSGNGSVIVGGSGSKPIIYTEAAGMKLLASVLTAQGVDLSNWSELQYVLSISPNGRYVVGGGLNKDNDDAGFVAKLALWGDVNQDDSLDLLDIIPFVDVLVNNGFLYEADINQDGAVDLLDVQPFVALLSAN